MKTTYVCEKCGNQFNDYHDAHTCESSHLYPEIYPSQYDKSNMDLLTYAPGSKMPTTITIGAKVWSYEDADKQVVMATYKLVKVETKLSATKTKEWQVELKEAAIEGEKRKVDMVAMKEALGDLIAADASYYWDIHRAYKSHFGHDYVRPDAE